MHAMRVATCDSIGISAIGTYEPPWLLSNDWFEGTISRKFVQHTGTKLRPISLEDEVTMAVQATNNLQREVYCDLRNCIAVLFVTPSFVPIVVARKYLDEEGVRQESIQRAARQFAHRLGISPRRVTGINWFCSGYAKALSIVLRRIHSTLSFGQDQFALVVTVSRISRITDYACKQTAPLFGDVATVTLLARTDSRKYPVHFTVLFAGVEKQAAESVFFDFQLRENVLLPTRDGGRTCVPRRLVFSLDGMGIADAAPRAMSNALANSLDVTHIPPGDVRFVVPHQAGTGILRLTAMKLEEIGIRGEVANGLTSSVGNLSSGSIPYALKSLWRRLNGTIACPTAAVGNPGIAEFSQGCILLRATQLHEHIAAAA
jgi:3-oxoacyl-[acyl-carrier-protein] synthase III